MDPKKVVVLEQDEQYWAGHGKRRRAPKGKSKHIRRPGKKRGKWHKIDTPNVLGDELDEMLLESGYCHEEE